MTINDPASYVAGLWDWAVLDGCFGQTRIRPTDIDGEVERNGWFLRLETKAPGAGIPEGQMRTFRQLIAIGRFTILVVWGRKGKPEKLRIMRPGQDDVMEPATLEDLRHEVAKWFRAADAFGWHQA